MRVGQSGFRVRDRVCGCPNFLGIVGCLRGYQLFPGSLQLFRVLGSRPLSENQLFIQHDQLRGQGTGVGIHVLDARGGQSEPALGQLHLLA